jgi:hypothetical protein
MHSSRLRKFALLVAGLACLPAPAGALITVGSLDLPTHGVAVVVKDGLAYIGTSWSGLVIADISDPKAPVEIGAIAYPSMIVRDVVVEGGLAYLAVEADARIFNKPPSSLRIIDITDPTAPVEIAAFEVSNQARGVAVVDNLAYFIVETDLFVPGPFPSSEIDPSGLRVIDVANPSAPTQVGTIDFDGAPHDIELVGDLAYIADDRGLLTVDVSDPTAPVEINWAASSDRPTSLTVVDGLAYVTNTNFSPRRAGGGLSVFDLSNPTAPIEIAYLQLPYWTYDVSVEDGLAYLAAYDAGLWAIDVSDPEAPVALGRLATPNAAVALAVADGLAHVLGSRQLRIELGSLQIIDLSVPTTPVEVGAISTAGRGYGVEVIGGLAYVTAGEEGLRVIDVSSPATPIEIGAIDTPDVAQGVTVVNSIAYVADGNSGLRIIDVSSPTAPVEIGAIDTPDSAWMVDVVNGLAYVADGYSGLRVIDVSDPSAPIEIGATETQYFARDVTVLEGLAYLADSYGGLRVIDVSNPEEPVEIGTLDSADRSLGVAVSDGRAYLANGYGGLRIIDVSNPEQPVELGAYAPGYEVFDVAVVGGIAYLGTHHIRAVDVSDPAAPSEIGGFDAYSFFGSTLTVTVGGLTVADGLVYAIKPGSLFTHPETRLHIIDFGPEYAPKIDVSIDIKRGGDSAPINSASRGVIPVAILGSDSFDVANIDVATLACGPDGATPAHRRGGHAEDVNGDGVMDLVSHFWTQDTGITSEEERVCVSGMTLEGAAFEGCGAI